MAPRPVPKNRHRHQTYFDVYGRQYSPYDPAWRMASRPRHQSTQIKRIRARIRSERRTNAANVISNYYRNRYMAARVRATQSNIMFFHRGAQHRAADTIARFWRAGRSAIAERKFWSRWSGSR